MKLKCKHCGNENLFYVKEHYSGDFNYIVNNDGSGNEDGYNSEMYDLLNSKQKSKYYFCYECDKKVAKIEDFKID